MCGIAGVIRSQSATLDDVRGMIAKIAYRGADEQGFQKVGPALLGHARLAVVDPVNGKQPMSNEDGTVWVTFNGEIYNYVELREELKAKGHKFKSRCDTEVLVHLWEEEGEKMLDRLIGMFAFFLWDERNDRGIIARDRQGIKPLYIAQYGGGLAFCSEIKGILTLPGFETKIDNDTLLHVFAFNYPPPPRTCFQGVTHVTPGTYLLLEGDKAPQTRTYWTWPLFEERRTPSFDEFAELLDDAVRLQMRFDVPGAMFLSGGVDSSVVAIHLAKAWLNPPLEALALDFKQLGFSEMEYSKVAAERAGVQLRAFEVAPDFVPDIAPKVVFHSDEPHGDFSFFLIRLLCQEAHRQKKIVMFNGDGPDETMLGFGQNERYFSGVGRMNFSLRSYFDLICYMNEEMRQRLLTDEFLVGRQDPVDKFAEILAPWESLEPMEQVAAYELTSLMPGNNELKGDRMGAAWSIEGRSPLLDHRVSELFVRLPLEEKFKNGVGKAYLKEYALRAFPRDFIYRPKTMPTMPIGEWVKSSLYEWTRETFSYRPDDGIFKTSALLKMLDDHRAGKRNHTSQIRTVLMTKLWLKEFFA